MYYTGRIARDVAIILRGVLARVVGQLVVGHVVQVLVGHVLCCLVYVLVGQLVHVLVGPVGANPNGRGARVRHERIGLGNGPSA